jgi:hypothetical protein
MRVGYVAAAWSIVYAVVLAADPAGPLRPPVALVLGTLGVCVAAVMSVLPASARHGSGRAGLLAFAWGSVLALAAQADALAIVGAFAWAATAVVFQRQSRGACAVCGRGSRAVRYDWATPAGAALWGAWSLGVVVAIPGLYLANRWPPVWPREAVPEAVPDAIVAASALPLGGAPVVWLVWIGALAATGYAWHLRRRGPCARCGRG